MWPLSAKNCRTQCDSHYSAILNWTLFGTLIYFKTIWSSNVFFLLFVSFHVEEKCLGLEAGVIAFYIFRPIAINFFTISTKLLFVKFFFSSFNTCDPRCYMRGFRFVDKVEPRKAKLPFKVCPSDHKYSYNYKKLKLCFSSPRIIKTNPPMPLLRSIRAACFHAN